MDALEFIRERNRMCKSSGRSCNDCPANDIDDCISAHWDEEVVPIVEKWSREHPCNTQHSTKPTKIRNCSTCKHLLFPGFQYSCVQCFNHSNWRE